MFCHNVRKFTSSAAVLATSVALALLSACGTPEAASSTEDATVAEDAVADVTADTTSDVAADVQVLNCTPTPTAEALVWPGQQGNRRILPGGRALTPAGQEVALGGFPIDLRMHPTLPLAYITNTGYTKRALQVVNTQTGALVQELDRGESFYGIALAPDGKKLYASGGYAGKVQIYDVGLAGELTATAEVPIDHYPAGIALSADGTRFWVGQFLATTDVTAQPDVPRPRFVVEFDTQTLAIMRMIEVPISPYALLEVPSRKELWMSSIADPRVVVLDLATDTTSIVDVGMGPVQLVASADGSMVYAGVSNRDVVVAIDAATKAVVGVQPVGETSIAGEDGKPLPASSPGGLALDAKTNRLYVVRAADNAVSVLNAKDLSPLGAIPVSWYPTAAALTPDASKLLVLNGKGLGTGPLPAYADGAESGKQLMKGSLSLVTLADLDLAAETKKVEDNVRRTDTVFPFQCDAPFPIPAQRGKPTPIQHIVLIVKENKTYDSVLGDLPVGNAEPKLTMWGKDVTPNLHALAEKYAHHDNFYNDSETSVQGHLWLTSSFVNDYMERTWFEDYRNHPGWDKDAVLPQGRPSFQTFFTHLIRHNVDFKMFGEIVGALDTTEVGSVGAHVDFGFPGSFFNTDISDVDKANHVADLLIDQGDFPPFVYVLLPNDHTHGLSAGSLTPRAMINDNDTGMGVLVDRITHSKYYESTAIFIVEDDPQMGADHVDYHRSFCVVVSPYAKPNYLSHVHTSYPSMFRSFELILNLPPMNRYDALATPMWDVFQQDPVPANQVAPFTYIPRTIPDEHNKAGTLGARISAHMDFDGPDRNPDLGDLLAWDATGKARPGSKIDRIVRGELPPSAVQPAGEREDEPEDDVYEAMLRQAWTYVAQHPELGVKRVKPAAWRKGQKAHARDMDD